MSIEIASHEQFIELLTDNRLVIADFYTNWCGPCKVLKPIFTNLAPEYNNIKFCTINIDSDDCNKIAEECEIVKLPTILYYIDGENVESYEGFDSKKVSPSELINKLKNDLEKLVKENFNNNKDENSEKIN